MNIRTDKNIFDRLDDIRCEIQDRIIHNQDLVKYLSYTDSDPLSCSDIGMDEIIDKIVGGDGNIFFQPRVMNTIQDNKSVLTMNFSVKKTGGVSNYATIAVAFTILVSYNNLNLIDGRYRPYRVCKCLDDIFNNTTGSWIGKMELYALGDVTAPTDYCAVGITYTSTDFK